MTAEKNSFFFGRIKPLKRKGSIDGIRSQNVAHNIMNKTTSFIHFDVGFLNIQPKERKEKKTEK